MQKLKLEELGRSDIATFKAQQKFPIIIVLDNIRSALNVGSAFRTADAFALEQIYCIGITATPPHREMMKTALGSTESVEWRHFEHIEDAIQNLRSEGYECYAIEQTNKSVMLDAFEIKPESKYALIFGNEVDGVSDEALAICNGAIEIPQFGTKHSLNVSVCVGILGWHFVNKKNHI
jgi:23S rRNA (guanosine2251-2'-O)-methyltransferase